MLDLSSDLFFMAVMAILSPIIVALVKPLFEKMGFLWAKINQRTVSAVIGGALGGIYRIPSLYTTLNGGETPPATVKEFILGGIMAGLAGSTIVGIMKDVGSGAIAVNSEAGIREVRRKTEAGKTRTPGDTIRGA
jgi:hypothetical protein